MPWEREGWGVGRGSGGAWGSWGALRDGGVKKGTAPDGVRGGGGGECLGQKGLGQKWSGAARKKRRRQGSVRLLGLPVEE